MNNQHINDVSELYNKEVKTDSKGRFVCPVCDKPYSTRAGIFNHIKEQDCAPPVKLFGDTITEKLGYDFFIATVCEFNKNQRSGLSAFRRSRYYKAVLRLMLHCMNNKVDAYLFYEWAKIKRKPRYYNNVLSIMMKDTSLVEFRKHLLQNEELIDSEKFYEQNEETILSNTSFLIRAIERGDIGLDFCLNHDTIDLGSKIDTLADANRIHLLKVVGIKEG